MMWTPIKGYEGLYDISDDGRIRSYQTNQIIHGNINSYGYRVVCLRKNGKSHHCKLHRLLAAAFIPNPNDYRCVNHIDGNKLNNSLDNLEWCTQGQNNSHARLQLSIDWTRKPVVQTTLDGKLIAVWSSANIAAKVIGGEYMMISACCKGTAKSAYNYCWKYLDRLLIE